MILNPPGNISDWTGLCTWLNHLYSYLQSDKSARYPIGRVVWFEINTNPATLFGFGTWVSVAVDPPLYAWKRTA